MSDFASRYERVLQNFLSENIEDKGEQLVINRQMTESDVHWHRGYIAALRDVGIFIQKDLQQKAEGSINDR